MKTSGQAGPESVLSAQVLSWAQSRWVKAGLQALRWAVPVLLVAFLGYRLSQIGWTRIWISRPANLAFYVVLPLIFFAQPLADLVIYRNLWKVGKAVGMGTMLRKRYLDNVVLDYSGEAWFYLWAQRNLNLPNKMLLHAIKDSNVLSAGAGLVLVWLVLIVWLSSGAVRIPVLLPHQSWLIGAVALAPLLFCLILLAGGRKVTTLSKAQIASTFAIHLLRGIAGLALQFALWWFSGALPGAMPCLEFVALQLLINRLPVVPNKDLLFAGAGIAMAGYLDLSAPAVAAVLLIGTAFDQLFGFVAVGLPWLAEEFLFRRKAAPPAA